MRKTPRLRNRLCLRGPWFLAAWLLLVWGCTTIVKEPNELHSFGVALSAGVAQKMGSPQEPLTYISGTSCEANKNCPGDEECIGYCAVSGDSCGTPASECPTGDYCRNICVKPVYLDIWAVGRDGSNFNLPGERVVHLKAVPGTIPPPYEYVTLTDGKASMVEVYIAQTFGESFIWVEDTGGGNIAGQYGQCNNNRDDDGDGFIDLADPECFDPADPLEAQATYATGLSPAFHFDMPRIWHIQYTDQVSTSPLEGHNIYVDKGDLVVTNIMASGFYATDLEYQREYLDDGVTPGYFNAFFFYTFNKPEGIGYGDILCSFSGGVVEYEGNTQMTFPTYDPATPHLDPETEEVLKDPATGRDLYRCGDRIFPELEVPEPVDVTYLLEPEDPASSAYKDQMMANARDLEPFESALVTISEVEASFRYIACDADEDGQYPSASDDDACRDECQLDPFCTQLESFFKYSQMAAYAQVGKKLYVGIDMLKKNVPLEIPYIGALDQSGNCPDLVDEDTGQVIVKNPHKVAIGDTFFYEYTCPVRELESITGNLRHIYLCSPKPGKKENCGLQMTMLVPRFDDDFKFVE